MPNDEDLLAAERQPEPGDSGFTASRFPDFEFKECKAEPDSDSGDEDLSEFERSSANLQRTLHVPVSVPTIKDPVVLLERCDKIWETLQLIRTQCMSSSETEDEEEQEEVPQVAKKVEQSNKRMTTRFNKTEQTLSDRNVLKPMQDVKTPFQFLVQKTRKLYPCVTCGKQYMEKRSLRNHALKEHGIVIPVKFRRSRKMRTDISDNTTASTKSLQVFKPKITKISFPCATCGKLYYEKRSLRRHALREHGVIIPVRFRRTRKMKAEANNSNNLPNEEIKHSEKLHSKYSHGKMSGKYKATKYPSTLNHMKKLNSSSNQSDNSKSLANSTSQYNRCALCQLRIKSLKTHLINYHKIGCSANMMKQLETSLSIETKSSGSIKPTLKDILSGKPPEASTNRSTQNKSYAARSEETGKETLPKVPQKRKYTISYVRAKKRVRLNNGRYVNVPDTSKVTTGQPLHYNCDICLGTYSNAHNLSKHKRMHESRGETKENFHKFKCNYFNSPMSTRYRLMAPSKSPNSIKNVDDDSSENAAPNKSSQNQKTSGIAQATADDEGKKDNTCICGRSFRSYHVLRAHKDNCKVCNQEDKALSNTKDEYSNDKDSGIGINITIKKRNNSYEIVGKDDEEEEKQADSVTDKAAKQAANSVGTEHQQPSEGCTSKYSKNHSILKLEDADEDLLVDIEDDTQHYHEKGRRTVGRGNVKRNASLRGNDGAEGITAEVPENIRTLKEMCQEVLEKLTTLQKTEDATAPPGVKRNLRSLSANQVKAEEERGRSKVSKAKFSLTTCAYCNEHFSTANLYNKHQCAVDEGRTFDEYSLNLVCFCCNATLDSCSQFDDHMRRKHDRAFHCYLCPEKFANRKLRNKHTNMQHDTSCKFCHIKTPLWMVSLHEAYHLGFGYPCHQCKKAYSTRRNLTYHITTIHRSGANNTVFCNLCLKSVKLKSFRCHMYNHAGNRCHFCSKEFSDRAGIEYHTLIYHGGAFSKLKCNDCGTRFLTKKHFEQHRKAGKCSALKKMREGRKVEENAEY